MPLARHRSARAVGQRGKAGLRTRLRNLIHVMDGSCGGDKNDHSTGSLPTQVGFRGMEDVMRSILVQAGHDPDSDARIETGLAIARAHAGHITLHINTPVSSYVSIDPFGGAHIIAELLDQARERDDALTQHLSARLARDDVPWSIETSDRDPASALLSSARLNDLVIMSLGQTSGAGGPRPPVGAVAIGARTPVLAMPAGVGFDAEGTAMLAWNGSDEAAHALRAAVPMLRRAAAVHVVTVTEERAGFPATDALSYLSRHDVHAELHQRERGLASVEEVLATCADDLAASYVVMGAYGHSRVRELLFGGVTRFAIDTTTRPLVLMG